MAVIDAASVQWGNVPTWVSVLLTSASIFAAFYIIIRDRRKAEREQAAQIVVWGEGDWENTGRYRTISGAALSSRPMKVTVWNTSKQPILRPRITHFFIDGGASYKDMGTFKADHIAAVAGRQDIDFEGRRLAGAHNVLMPDEQVVTDVHLPNTSAEFDLHLYFQDAAGMHWIRSIATGRLYRPKLISSEPRWAPLRRRWDRLVYGTRLSWTFSHTRAIIARLFRR